jgi:hypothetical protein
MASHPLFDEPDIGLSNPLSVIDQKPFRILENSSIKTFALGAYIFCDPSFPNCMRSMLPFGSCLNRFALRAS